ncbi:MAG: sugar transferase [Planctomycetaceae bacterium]|nr:sugar transferase [Planctomycetaceae bacterium]
MALAWIVASIDTRQNGLFIQMRVGRDGRLFPLLKIRTMRTVAGWTSTVTTGRDPRITTMGRLLRRTKLDELPQLLNVLMGDMSLVGPRPDVPGFADRLQGADRVVLTLRPGITGPATLRFRDEEALLAAQPDPERYNREVIWPEKVRLNRQYAERYTFRADLVFILRTLMPRGARMPSGVSGK